MGYYKLKQDLHKLIDKGYSKEYLKKKIDERLNESIYNYKCYLRNFQTENDVRNFKRFFGFEWKENLQDSKK